MAPFDLAVILLYFGLTLGLGIRAARGQHDADDYFLGARNLPAWAVLISIVATETSAVTVISTPGIGATGNLTFLQLPIGYLAGRIGVAWWLLPGYFRGEQETAYARLEKRFGVGSRRLLSLIFLVTRFMGDGVRVYAGAIPLALLAGWDPATAIVVMGAITLLYTWFGGLRAVIWTDVLQWLVYVGGGIIALLIAWQLGGGMEDSLQRAREAGKLQVFDWHLSLTAPYTFLAGLLGGGLLSAASHGTDHLIVQRLLGTRSLKDAGIALVGSGVVVILQFALFLLIGTALWAAGMAPEGVASDQYFSRFIVTHLPPGVAGLLIAGILAAAMSTQASSINALASSFTHDQYVPLTGITDPATLLKVGRRVSLAWGIALVLAALGFQYFTGGGNTPVVVLALSIASITYGVLLGGYILAGTRWIIPGRSLIHGAGATVALMLVTVFANRLSAAGWTFLTPAGRLAWPWYVPLGTLLMIGITAGSARLVRKR